MVPEYLYDLVIIYKNNKQQKELYNYETLEDCLLVCKALFICEEDIEKITLVQNKYKEKNEENYSYEPIAFTDLLPNFIDEDMVEPENRVNR